MKSSSFYLSTVGKALNWARSSSLWYVSTGVGCCADEVLNAMGARYDLERFGCLPQFDGQQADLLIINGIVTQKAAPHLKALYDSMIFPKSCRSTFTCRAARLVPKPL
jgi:NADH-quinone oxidoreductase subunit B